MAKVKVCPFCGHKPSINRNPDDDYIVYCNNKNCLVRPHTQLMNTEEDAIDVWNERNGDMDLVNKIYDLSDLDSDEIIDAIYDLAHKVEEGEF